MKRILLLAAAVIASLTVVSAQEAEKKVKTGWSLSTLPSVSFSSDQGFQYGIFGNLYNYGDGSTYPEYRHSIGYEVSHFTKGRTRLFLSYDSKYLIPGIRVNASVTYMLDPLYNFYGFNGAAQVYQPQMSANRETGVNFYGMSRNMLRVLADFQGNIAPHFNWAAGFAFWNFKIDKQMDYGYYNPDYSLYHDYITHGFIRDSEKDGGTRLELKAGLVYDTRDREAAPNRGIWAELYFGGSPSITNDNFNYLKLNAHFRQYISTPIQWKGGGINLAYHLAYTGTIAGEVPFYMQQNVPTLYLRQMISEGLGSGNTMRGFYGNRMVADGYAWANAELRIKLFSFTFLKQFFYVAVNPFYDCGAIVQPYRVEEMAKVFPSSAEQIAKQARTFEHSAGIGVKIAWNENFIVSVEMAKALKNSGLEMGPKTWINIGTGYAF